MILQCNGHYTETAYRILNVETQFSRAGIYINHPANLPTIKLMDTS